MSRILLVDDDPGFRTMLEALLTKAAHDVICAENGKEALRCYVKSEVDLVITDLVMPEMEGIETITALRELNPQVRIIAMSGDLLNSPVYLKTAKIVGAMTVLEKPFPAHAFLRAVENALE
jgi:DNA-binding NtrC family response regulator